MISQTLPIPPPAVKELVRPKASSTRWQTVFVTSMVLAHLPLLYWHLTALLAKPHFQFVLLLPFAVAALAWPRYREVAPVESGSAGVSGLMAVFPAGLLAIATYLWSPWLAAVSAMLTLLVAMYAFGGRALVRSMMAPYFLLWFFVGLPFDLDVELIKVLREVATKWSSALLDEFGMRHLVAGNVIEVPGQAFFVADACSGIHSLFVILAACLFIAAWNRRPLHQTCALLLCGAALVIVENLTRLVGVVLSSRVGIDLSEGWRHEVFGGVVFVATLLLVLSADQFLSFVLPERLWRSKRRRAAELAASTGAAVRVVRTRQRNWAVPASAFAIGFLAIGIWQLARAPAKASELKQYSLVDAFTPLSQLKVDDLPERIDSFARRGIRFEKRALDDPKGNFSQIWLYDRGGSQLEMSVDYPYSIVRDLCLCYELTGWTVDSQRLVVDGPEQPNGDRPPPFIEAVLSKPFRGNAYLYFSFLNEKGENGVRLFPREETSSIRRILGRLGSFVGRGPEPQEKTYYEISGPVMQIQLLAVADHELSSRDRDELARFYCIARDHLQDACLKQLGGAK